MPVSHIKKEISSMSKKISQFLIIGLVLISGCGYHFNAGGAPEGLKITSLAIPLMETTSSTLGFESDFTSAIRDAFIRQGNVPLESQDRAEFVLKGKIREIHTDPLTYDITETPVQGTTSYYEITDSRRMRVTLDTRLVERKTGKVIWEEKQMEERARYLVSEDPMTNRYNRKKALHEIAGRLVDRIYLRTMERF